MLAQLRDMVVCVLEYFTV